MLMTAQASLAFTVSKPWEPPTFSSQRHAGSPRGTSQVHLAGTPYLIFSFVHSPYNGALYQTQLPKP